MKIHLVAEVATKSKSNNHENHIEIKVTDQVKKQNKE
jgi:hypothetical protein